MFAPHPVPIVYASAPILKPKPIRPTINTNLRSQSIPRTPPQPKQHHRRPSILRASTLDGRSLSEVIDAAHRASLNERPKTLSNSPFSSVDSSAPHSRRMSYDSSSSSFSYPNEYQYRRSSSSGTRTDAFFDQHNL